MEDKIQKSKINIKSILIWGFMGLILGTIFLGPAIGFTLTRIVGEGAYWIIYWLSVLMIVFLFILWRLNLRKISLTEILISKSEGGIEDIKIQPHLRLRKINLNSGIIFIISFLSYISLFYFFGRSNMFSGEGLALIPYMPLIFFLYTAIVVTSILNVVTLIILIKKEQECNRSSNEKAVSYIMAMIIVCIALYFIVQKLV